MIRSLKGMSPRIASSAYVEETARIIGDVEIGEESSIWFVRTRMTIWLRGANRVSPPVAVS
jgi:carbonic anhydrase/acetyltransferase-like protein (isoleucine patch superfamily)